MEDLFKEETGCSFDELLEKCKTNKEIAIYALFILPELISKNKNTEYLVDYAIKLVINSNNMDLIFDIFNTVLNNTNTNKDTVKIITKKLIDIRYQDNDIVNNKKFIEHYNFLIIKIMNNEELLDIKSRIDVKNYLENAKLKPADKLITDIISANTIQPLIK